MQKQKDYWSGKDGDEYTQRNLGRVEQNTVMFAKILPLVHNVDSVIEFGAGAGENLKAIHALRPSWELWAVELNKIAAGYISVGNVLIGSMLEVSIPYACDLVLTKGLLIHIHPDDLPRAYQVLFQSSKRYILICEYYSPKPAMIPYRGALNRLWKRDFAGEMLDRYPQLKLVDYGFVYHRDRYPQDDLNWFLLKKI